MTKTLKGTLEALKYHLSFLNNKENKGEKAGVIRKGKKIQSIRHGKVTWVDVIGPSRREISQLAQKYPFHPLHLEDCISKGQFPKLEQNEEDKYIFLLLRLPILHDRQENIAINQVCFFLGKNYLVTVHDNPKDTISNIFSACEENAGQRKVYINSSASHLLYTIINSLANDLTRLLQAILKEVDETEDIVFDDKISGAFKIGQLRRKILSSRRVVAPLRILFEEMAARINKFSKNDLSIYFDNIADQINKTWDTLEEAKETVDIYKDADFIISSEKTNRTLAVLTIIFTLTIPATVIGTLYGMNILLPGGIGTGSWGFLGRYTSFILILIIAVLPALVMLLYFRKRSWF